ncbi:MAG: uracil-DNA glycosylase [Myxococcota bacterium]
MLPSSWQPVLGAETESLYFSALMNFVEKERAEGPVYPPTDQVFAALEHTAYDDVKVLLLGQDPYHGKGQAHGLCFSVQPGVRVPPSLRNMYKELNTDLDLPIPSHGHLTAWAEQGVLLLNTILTVREATPKSHAGQGWETFTDAIIRAVNEKSDRVVFMLWGGPAKKKKSLVKGSQHVVLTSAHPSPLSARNGFFGSRPFSKANEALIEAGREPVDWSIR